jgi:hypothetical protein
MTRLRPLLLLLAVGAALALPGAAGSAHAAPSRLGGQFRYWSFDRGGDLRDPLVYWAGRHVFAQVEYWDYADDSRPDHWRPELRLMNRDARNSSYHVGWRHEYRRERLFVGTDQVLSDHLVGRVELSPIVWADSTDWVVSTGADWYWGSYNFAGVDVIRDPREDGLWVVPMRLRLATEANDWVQVTVAPASRRTIGWAFDLKWRRVRAGIERNSRYDFTGADNVITTIGFETPFPRPTQ